LWIDRSRALENKGSIFIESSKQGNSSTNESGSPGAKFNKHFLILWGTSMKWRPFLPNDGVFIHMDIIGHPPFPTVPKQFSDNFGNLLFFAVLTFGAILRA
jgi:hypothetical protein